MRPNRARIHDVLPIAAAILLHGCVAPSDGPPVDPDSIQLGEGGTAEDASAFEALIEWLDTEPKALYTGVWTNWYNDGLVVGLAKLSSMRTKLNESNLFHSYNAGARTGHYPTSFTCPATAQQYRQIDGSCNDLDDPGMGAVGTRFGHNVPLNEVVAETGATLVTPNPREISRQLFTRRDFQPVPFLNLLAVAWIQFMVHDWFSHGANSTTESIQVPMLATDPLRIRTGLSALSIPATLRDPTRLPSEASLPPTYQNETTHWWDGSQIYGSDLATSNRLRSFSGGRLLVDAAGRLPVASDGVEDTGFKRNWWLGLTLMHYLFVHEHNAIADMLHARYLTWNDERLFHTARLVNSALMAKIHTIEWTPAILPNDTLEAAMNANWSGVIPGIAFLFNNPALGGIIGNPRDLAGVPFSMTEEFVSVYRMHPLLPESIDIRDIGSTRVVENVTVPATRNAGARTLAGRVAMDDLFYSFGAAHPGALVLHNYPRFLQDLAMPGMTAFDMGTTDIVRDRERGVPRYNEFRRLIQLQPLTSIDQITPNAAIVAELKAMYGNDIEKVDTLVGMLAEGYRPTNFGFGETAFQIFILIASRRLHADRFYTDSYDTATYSRAGLDWVDDNGFQSVLLRHLPALAETGLVDVENPFEPWE